jgi:hypothetical protein
MRSSTILPVATCLAVAPFVLGQSRAGVLTDSGSDLSIHEITASGSDDHWSLVPPTVEITGAATIRVFTTGAVIHQDIPPNLQDKFTLTSTPNGLVFGGKNDFQRADAVFPGLIASSYGQWDSSATTFQNTNSRFFRVHMLTTARVDALDPPLEYLASARAKVADPFTIPGLEPGEAVDLRTVLPAGQSLQADGLGVAERELRVGTSLAGFETLYALTLRASFENNTPVLSAIFSSHPLLGLDDVAIMSAVTNAFALDAGTQSFSLIDDFTLFEGSVLLPAGEPFELFIDDAAGATIVPEPAGLVLLALGSAIGLRRRRGAV